MENSRNILSVKFRSANNALRGIRKHVYLHMFVGFTVVFGLIGGGTAFFYEVFDFLMRQEVFGPPLMDRLVGIVFLAFFSMLIFSNLIITLSTAYISREVDFLFSLPLTARSLFRQKLLETVVYSSWAFAVLSFPLFVAFGMARDVAWHFYPMLIALIIPFLLIPAALGSILTMVVTAFLPARRTRTLSILLGILSIAIGLMLAKMMGFTRILATANENFLQIMSILGVGSSPFLPSSWITRGLVAIGPGEPDAYNLQEYLYWLAMLWSTALFLIELSDWLVPKLYYRGWCLSKDTANLTVASHAKWSPLVLVDQLFFFLPPARRALLSKDLKTFWRDPSQWTQLVILFGLMIIYLVNLRATRRYSQTLENILNEWATILAFFNLGATCFILSILTTRFIYPMLSLEGRQFWSIGLAPMPRTAIVWQKYVLCVICSLAFVITLLLLSNQVLNIEPYMKVISLLTVVTMAIALSSLSIGIGALLPNFREDNPARIANGLGGTTNAILSLAYIGITVCLLVVPVNLHARGLWDRYPIWVNWSGVYMALLILMQFAVIVVPMYLGIKRWKQLEF